MSKLALTKEEEALLGKPKAGGLHCALCHHVMDFAEDEFLHGVLGVVAKPMSARTPPCHCPCDICEETRQAQLTHLAEVEAKRARANEIAVTWRNERVKRLGR